MASDACFSLMELSAVREMANVGLGHATTALSEMAGRSFRMEIPNAESLPMETVMQRLGGKEDLAVGVYMPFEGDMEGQIAFVFPWASAQSLWNTLLGSAPATPDDVDELAGSAMLEIGNIINSSYLNAISDMTGSSLQATPPLVSVDSSLVIASTIVAEAAIRDVVAITIETRIFAADEEGVNGFFLCIPTVDGLRQLFAKLGLVEAA